MVVSDIWEWSGTDYLGRDRFALKDIVDVAVTTPLILDRFPSLPAGVGPEEPQPADKKINNNIQTKFFTIPL